MNDDVRADWKSQIRPPLAIRVVVQVTRRLLAPGMVARRLQTDDAQGHVPGDDPGRARNAVENLLLVLTTGETLRVQPQS